MAHVAGRCALPFRRLFVLILARRFSLSAPSLLPAIISFEWQTVLAFVLLY